MSRIQLNIRGEEADFARQLQEQLGVSSLTKLVVASLDLMEWYAKHEAAGHQVGCIRGSATPKKSSFDASDIPATARRLLPQRSTKKTSAKK